MINKIFLSLTSCLLFTFISCSASFNKPEINLVDINFLESSLLETNLKLKIRVVNSDNKALQISGSKHLVSFNGKQIGTALSNQKFEVPALTDATQEVTLRISNLSMLTKVQDLINSKGLEYDLDSTFYTNEGYLGSSIKASTSGTFYK